MAAREKSFGTIPPCPDVSTFLIPLLWGDF